MSRRVVVTDTQTAVQTVVVRDPVRVKVPTAVKVVDSRLASAKEVVVKPVLRTEIVRQSATKVDRGPPGPEGPQGPPGPAGGSAIEMPSGETIFGLRAVRAVGGQIFHPDQTDNEHAEQVIGIALQSGTGTLLVQISGTLTEGSWTWTPGLVYCGADGVLTQSPPATGWLLAVGRAIAADTLEIDIDTAFYRG